MFGRLRMTVAGIAAAGLLAVGAPASAATPVDDTPASGTSRAAVAMRDLVSKAGVSSVWDLVRVTVGKGAPSAASGRYAAAQPYTVYVNNETADYLQAQVYWEEKNTSGVFGGGIAPLNPHATSTYELASCTVVSRYLLNILYQGELVAQTPITSPSSADGYACADFWAIGYE